MQDLPTESSQVFYKWFNVNATFTPIFETNSMAMAVTALRNAGVINQDAIMRDAADDAGSTFQDNKIRLFCFILGRSKDSFSVKVKRHKTVEDLRDAIIVKAELATNNVQIFKVHYHFYEDGWALINLEAARFCCQEMNAEWRDLYNEELLQKYFDPPPRDGVHIVIQLSSWLSYGDDVIEGGIAYPAERKWVVDGSIRLVDIPGSYYLDVSKQEVTKRCLHAVECSQFVLLSGPRASGKSTRLNMLAHILSARGYEVIKVTFQYVSPEDSMETFWDTFSFCSPRFPRISSPRDFLQHFQRHVPGEAYVVPLIDEFSLLHSLHPVVRDSFLNVFRALRDADGMYKIRSAGTYSMTYLRSSNKVSSSFISGHHIQNPNFTLEEVGQLFREFAKDRNIEIGNDIIEDVFSKTNGHAGLVCLCGRTIAENLKLFVFDQIMSNKAWRAYPAHFLYESILRYNTFGSMFDTLENLKADPAITLLRRHFLGYLGDVCVTDDEKPTPDLLTSEGVLLKTDPDQLYYRMSSPLVDGLIRTKLLRALYPLTPPGVLPRRHDDSLDIVRILEKAVTLFDRQHMADASQTSFKSSGTLTVHGRKKCQVPRESVYDTELMRVLSNWLTLFGWKVTSQWHSLNGLNQHNITLTFVDAAKKNTVVF